MATENTTQSGMGASTGTAQSGMNDAGSTGFGTTGNTGTTGTGAEGIGGMARNLATEAKQKAGEQVRSSVDKGRTRAADTLQEVARTLMGASEGEENPAAPYMNRAGEQVQRLAEYLRDSDVRQMVTGAEQFARRQPVLFLGAAFAVGVVAARFLKSTRPDGGRYGGDMGYGMEGYDRERSLASYREPSTGYSAGYGADYNSGDLTGGMTGGMTGAAGSGMSGMSGGTSGGLGGTLGGDENIDDTSWPNTGGTGTSSTDNGPSGRR